MIDRKDENTVAHTTSDERGMVSIVVTVVLMLVISITVLGFAQIIRREQRQALDEQLSSQAFYAAESGINAARQAIADINDPLAIKPKKQCGPVAPYMKLDGKVDSNANVSYSCLLITGAPKGLKYDISTTQPSKVFPVFTDDGTTINSIDVEWSPAKDVANPIAGCPSMITSTTELPASNAWPCAGYGIVRVDLVPVMVMNRPSLMANEFTSFFNPTTSGIATVSYTGSGQNIYGGSANQGSRPSARCDANSCKITIKNLPAGFNKYYMRISALYRDTTVTVTAKDVANTPMAMTGAQIMIDSTGKAQDVLRRVQVRVPLVHDGLHNDYGIESKDSMCKLFYTAWGHQNTEGTCS